MSKNINPSVILKVSADTNLALLITSTYEHLKSEGVVVLDSIGKEAAYIALRAAIFTKKQLPDNKVMLTDPGMVQIMTPEGERKAIRLTLSMLQE